MFEETEDPEEHWLEEHAEFVLALHGAGCVTEAIQDAIESESMMTMALAK